MKSQSLETDHPELFSSIRRNINSLRQTQTNTRKQAITDLLKIVKEQSLPAHQFQQIMMMGNKDLLKCLQDSSEYNRQHALIIIIQLIQRCENIVPFLPYIFAALIDRTNCNDLEGIANLPEKMRPAPGQKPKVIIKLSQNCQQIRALFCTLMKKILSLVDEHQIRDKLDEIVNILRTLIMDPSPEIQKSGCETLQFLCKTFKNILLHYTQIMGRAVLLPLVSKKSKIRIAALNALTSIFWCGLWKYNAFVFQNLIGFRDPNSVPIKDFYQPSNNINYLATFVNDSNVKVRQQFIKHIKIWTCDLDDKYDHHGRIVPYILSGMFDKDDIVRETAFEIIKEIGKQIQIEKEKEFRDGRQYAIDAAWTWEGQLVNLPVDQPINTRPSLGSRVFIRGHVRKFWTALYKQIKDINYDNRIRSAYLVLYGTIYTQNYMTQYLNEMLPHLLSSIIPIDEQDRPVAELLQKTMFYIGRYCEVSGYLHIMSSAIKGELIQNQQFLKAALKGLAKLIEGAFDSIPIGTGLCHKRIQIQQLITMIDQCNICAQIYQGNSIQSLQVVQALLKGLKTKAQPSEQSQIMQTHSLSLIKLFSAGYYESYYSQLTTTKKQTNSEEYAYIKYLFGLVSELYPNYFDVLDNYMRQAYMNPPSLMDSDWKLIIVIHNYLTQSNTQEQQLIFELAQEVIAESLNLNRSLEILSFVFKYISYLFQQVPLKQKLANMHLVLVKSLQNFSRFKPIKKVPIYDQHLIKPQTDMSVIKINEDQFIPLFISSSQAIQTYYINKIQIPAAALGQIIYHYLTIFNKFSRDQTVVKNGVKTMWITFERAELTEVSPTQMIFGKEQDKNVPFQTVIDFLVERLQTLGEPDQQRLSMLFDIFKQIVRCCPKIPSVMTKLPHFYPNYPQLLQKLFKYAMDQKDMQTRQRYKQLLTLLCSKLRPWFQLQLRLSQQKNRFARVNLLRAILDKVR